MTMTLGGSMNYQSGKKPLNSGVDPDQDPDPGIKKNCEGVFQHFHRFPMEWFMDLDDI